VNVSASHSAAGVAGLICKLFRILNSPVNVTSRLVGGAAWRDGSQDNTQNDCAGTETNTGSAAYLLPSVNSGGVA
jgi:hypothetical protein